jgi:hypothetical protein
MYRGAVGGDLWKWAAKMYGGVNLDTKKFTTEFLGLQILRSESSSYVCPAKCCIVEWRNGRSLLGVVFWYGVLLLLYSCWSFVAVRCVVIQLVFVVQCRCIYPLCCHINCSIALKEIRPGVGQCRQVEICSNCSSAEDNIKINYN